MSQWRLHANGGLYLYGNKPNALRRDQCHSQRELTHATAQQTSVLEHVISLELPESCVSPPDHMGFQA